MKRSIPLVAAGLSIVVAPWPALRANPAAGLALNAEAYIAVVGQPPAAGSAEEAKDLAILRWNQRTRYPQAVEHAWGFLNRDIGVFDTAIGANLAKAAPTLAKGLRFFLKEVDRVKNVLKERYRRPRPFLTHKDLKPCLPLESSFSFPSGHSTWYAAAGLLLADLLPQRRQRLLSMGQQGGYARAYCQVHYPSDVLASERLARAISKDIIASAQWQAFRRQVAAELPALLQPPPGGLPLLSH